MTEDLAKDPNSKYLFEKGILDPFKFPGAPLPPPVDASEGQEAPKEKVAEDDSPTVTNLRNLFRAGRIDKTQYVGSLATLYATGLINNGQFIRLKKAAN